MVRPLGSPYRLDVPFESRASERLLTRGSAGTIWEAPFFEYRVSQFDTLGSLVKELRGEHVPMPPPGKGTITPRQPRDPPPTPFLGGIGWDEDQGVLWVAVSVAHEDWARRLGARERVGWPTMEERYGPSGSLRRTQLDAWDPVEGKLLASTILSESWRSPIGPGIGLSYSSSPEGYLFLDVWRANLERRRK